MTELTEAECPEANTIVFTALMTTYKSLKLWISMILLASRDDGSKARWGLRLAL